VTDAPIDHVMLPLPNLLETVRSRSLRPLALPSLQFLRTPLDGEEPVKDSPNPDATKT
jgi:hypothetical protein